MVHEIVGWLERCVLNVAGEAERSQRQNSVPINVELIPGEAVTRGLRGGMVIIVPALSEGEYGDPETVGRVIAGAEALRSPHMCCGVHQPSGVETDDGTEKDNP